MHMHFQFKLLDEPTKFHEMWFCCWMPSQQHALTTRWKHILVM